MNVRINTPKLDLKALQPGWGGHGASYSASTAMRIAATVTITVAVTASMLLTPATAWAQLNSSQNALHPDWAQPGGDPVGNPGIQNPRADGLRQRMEQPNLRQEPSRQAVTLSAQSAQSAPSAQWTQSQPRRQQPVLRGRTERIEYQGSDDSLPAVPTTRSLTQARRWTEDYKLDGAEASFKAMLARNPNNPWAHHGLGRVYYYRTTSSNENVRMRRDQLLNGAAQEFQTALLYRPNMIDALLDLGTVYTELDRWTEAGESFEKAYRMSPNHSEVNEKMGMLRLHQGDTIGAIAHLKKAVGLNPRNSSAYYHLGVAYTETQQYNNAHRALMQAQALNPNSAPVHHQLGTLYEAQGNGAAATEHFKHAIAIKPEYKPARLMLANHYQGAGDYSLALDQLQRLAESYPDDTKVRHQAARVALANGQPDVATQHYRQILDQTPGDRQARRGLSESQTQWAENLMAKDDLVHAAEADTLLKGAISNNDDNLMARLKQIRLHHGSTQEHTYGDGHLVAAIINQAPQTMGQAIMKGEVLVANYQLKDGDQAFRVALNSTRSPAQTLTLGEMMVDLGHLDIAAHAFRRLLTDPQYSGAARLGLNRIDEALEASEAKYWQALLYGKGSKDRMAAIPLLREALDLNQKNAKAHQLLARLYEKQKYYGPARNHYYAYLELRPEAKDRAKIEKKINRLATQVQRYPSTSANL